MSLHRKLSPYEEELGTSGLALQGHLSEAGAIGKLRMPTYTGTGFTVVLMGCCSYCHRHML